MEMSLFTTLDSLLQYYLTENDIGQNRASVAIKKLAELNNYVNVTCHTSVIAPDFLKDNRVNVSLRFSLVLLRFHCLCSSFRFSF